MSLHEQKDVLRCQLQNKHEIALEKKLAKSLLNAPKTNKLIPVKIGNTTFFINRGKSKDAAIKRLNKKFNRSIL